MRPGRYQVYLATMGFLISDTAHEPARPVWAPDDEPGTYRGYWHSKAAAARVAADLNTGAIGVRRVDGAHHAVTN